MTINPHLEDEYLVSVAKDLRSYGRVLLRINHECTGNWFCYTKRATYPEIADFFVRFNKILKTITLTNKSEIIGDITVEDFVVLDLKVLT